VRPDGVVAWRSKSLPADPAVVVSDVAESLGFIPSGAARA
jgi:hypothetical protein